MNTIWGFFLSWVKAEFNIFVSIFLFCLQWGRANYCNILTYCISTYRPILLHLTFWVIKGNQWRLNECVQFCCGTSAFISCLENNKLLKPNCWLSSLWNLMSWIVQSCFFILNVQILIHHWETQKLLHYAVVQLNSVLSAQIDSALAIKRCVEILIDHPKEQTDLLLRFWAWF